MTTRPDHAVQMTLHESDSGASYSYRPRRSKTDWAGISVGDAFKANLDYYVRLPAQKMFYRLVKRYQRAAARLSGQSNGNGFKPLVKPQISPCYSTYPATHAAFAAIGLTGFLEFRARAQGSTLQEYVQNYLEDPAGHDQVEAEPGVYKEVAVRVTKIVETRLLMEDLSRTPGMAAVEVYRLFSASMQNLKFRSLPEIVEGVVLYGDIYPNWQALGLHPMTQRIFHVVWTASATYFAVISETRSDELVDLGAMWVADICRQLAHFLPKSAPRDHRESLPADILERLQKAGEAMDFEFDNKPASPTFDENVPPLDGQQPPSLFERGDLPEQVQESMLNAGRNEYEDTLSPPSGEMDEAVPEAVQELLTDFSETVMQAGGQQKEWEDMRSDLVEVALRASGFEPGPVEGNPADGHEVTVQLGENETAHGELFDRPVELSDDLPAYEQLVNDSKHLTEELRRVLYPNVEQLPIVQRFCTSGSRFDNSRLPLAYFSLAIFERWRIHEQADRRGRPVLVIACDGSGSLNHNQMQLLKLLAAAWLTSTAKTEIQVLAGLYHSGTIRPGTAGPLVQWIYHPKKTPTTGRPQAARAVVTLPDTGTGVQSDALSLAFMMQEAQAVARGRMVYLILLTDCAWNRSFNGKKTGQQEVLSLFESLYDSCQNKLHTTLVALGVESKTGFEELLDKVIRVTRTELTDYQAVARKIAVYVASCLNERNKLVARQR
ncbi:MAG: hypothetical protein ACE5IY_12300 [bacterium]